MSVLALLWELLVNTLENMTYALLFMKCLILKEKIIHHKIIIYFFIAITETLITSICNLGGGANSIITQVMLFATDYLMVSLLFEDTLSKKLFVSIFPTFISMMADRFTFIIGGLIASGSLSDFIYEGSTRYCSTFIYLIFCVLLALLFGKLFQRDIYLTFALRITIYASIVLSIIFTNFFLDIITSLENFHLPAEVRNQIQVLSIGFIFILMLLIFLIQKTGQIYEQNLSLEAQFHQEQISQAQLNSSIQAMENIRSWKHDYTNHLITLMGLLQEEKYMELSDYLHQLQTHSPDCLSIVSSGNSSIDAIVTSKLLLARQDEIHFQYSILLPMICPLSDLELTAILGNLLDNSLEACNKVITEKKGLSPYVKLIIKPFRDMLQIQVTNSSNGNYRFGQNGKLRTTKEGTHLHGYGLKRISSIIEDAGGIWDIQPEKDKFTVNILVPISEKKNTDRDHAFIAKGGLHHE